MKKICVILAVVLSMGLLSGCGPKKDCELCGKEQSAGRQFEGSWLCDSCYEGAKALEALFGALG